ncbi:MAG TPA: transcriptional regulator [Rhizomicrobium sp.]|jgi:DNA-binding phage protein|nr:transcriptional regulator [Rhizomicrobium sp.]
MPLTRDFKETVMEDMRRSAGFRAAMLREGIDALFAREYEVGKEVLRDYINATMGFDSLAKQVKIPPKSLMRMLGPSGNPQMKNLFAVIDALKRHAGIDLHLAAE